MIGGFAFIRLTFGNDGKRPCQLVVLCLLAMAISGCKRYDQINDDTQLQLKAGRWENGYNLTQIDVPGLRQAHRDKITSEISKAASGPYCLEPAYVVSPPASFFGGKGATDCKYQSYDVERGKAKITLRCSMRGLGLVETELDGHINAEQFDFASKVSVRLPMIGKVNFQGTSTGSFIGACKGDE
jgi:Protein of unknown function (DUF3617)